MANRVSFSGDHVGLTEIAAHHRDLESSLTLYFSAASPRYPLRFDGYAANEVTDELVGRLDEADLASSLTVLASVEAAFRIDYGNARNSVETSASGVTHSTTPFCV